MARLALAGIHRHHMIHLEESFNIEQDRRRNIT
jgi:hypothetical protein